MGKRSSAVESAALSLSVSKTLALWKWKLARQLLRVQLEQDCEERTAQANPTMEKCTTAGVKLWDTGPHE